MSSNKKPYYGPAGIFSTDNAQSDQMQIDAEQHVDEGDDELSGVICVGCGNDLYLCTCQDEPERYQPEKYYEVTAGCDRNPEWYDFNLSVPESDVELVKSMFAQNHRAQCNCGGEPTISVHET